MDTNSSIKKIRVLFNDYFELCGDFDSVTEYNVSLYAKELNTEQLKALYERNAVVSKSAHRGWLVIINKMRIKEVDFYEC
jgi:hypothetical protein